MKKITRYICDNCGKVNPELLHPERELSSATKCCQRADFPNMSLGKRWKQTFRFPIKIKWVGFWSNF